MTTEVLKVGMPCKPNQASSILANKSLQRHMSLMQHNFKKQILMMNDGTDRKDRPSLNFGSRMEAQDKTKQRINNLRGGMINQSQGNHAINPNSNLNKNTSQTPTHNTGISLPRQVDGQQQVGSNIAQKQNMNIPHLQQYQERNGDNAAYLNKRHQTTNISPSQFGMQNIESQRPNQAVGSQQQIQDPINYVNYDMGYQPIQTRVQQTYDVAFENNHFGAIAPQVQNIQKQGLIGTIDKFFTCQGIKSPQDPMMNQLQQQHSLLQAAQPPIMPQQLMSQQTQPQPQQLCQQQAQPQFMVQIPQQHDPSDNNYLVQNFQYESQTQFHNSNMNQFQGSNMQRKESFTSSNNYGPNPYNDLGKQFQNMKLEQNFGQQQQAFQVRQIPDQMNEEANFENFENFDWQQPNYQLAQISNDQYLPRNQSKSKGGSPVKQQPEKTSAKTQKKQSKKKGGAAQANQAESQVLAQPQDQSSAQFKIQQIHQILKINTKPQHQNQGKGRGKSKQQDLGPAEYLTLDIVQDIAYECCIDQKCSRFIQDRFKMNIDNSEQVRFYNKLLLDPKINFDQLVKDQNGNYIIQKILQNTTGDQPYHSIIFEKVKGHVLEYSMHKQGCRVVQTCFEILDDRKKELLLKELTEENRVKECCYNFNGNHVIQKIFNIMGQDQSNQDLINLIGQVESNAIEFCHHEYCCRVIQRMTEFCAPPLMQRMIEKILQKYQVLIKDEYGTFVICSVLEHGDDQHRLFLLNQINHNVKDMSIDRDGSKLLENCIKMIGSSKIQKGSDLDSLQTQILEQVLSLPMPKNFQDNENQFTIQIIDSTKGVHFSDVLTNKYGNFIIQACFEKSNQEQKRLILKNIKKTLDASSTAGETHLKHILKFLQTKHNISRELVNSISLGEGEQIQIPQVVGAQNYLDETFKQGEN